MLVEVATGFFLPRLFQCAYVLGLAKGQTIGIGPRLIGATLGTLSHRPKIDQFSHQLLRYFGNVFCAVENPASLIDQTLSLLPLIWGFERICKEQYGYSVSKMRAHQYTVS